MNNIIEYSYQDTPVFFQSNAFINANSVAAKFNKKPDTYLKTKRTKEYIEALKKALFPDALKSATEQNQLVKIQKGGKPEEQGTWIHPKLAIDFARWLNADFAVWCDMQIEKLLHPVRNAIVELSPDLPAKRQHIKTVVLASAKKKGESYGVVYNRLFTYIGIHKLENFQDKHYAPACQFLNVKPKVFEGELLEPEKIKTITTPAPTQALYSIKRLRGLSEHAMPSEYAQAFNADLDVIEHSMRNGEVNEAKVVSNLQGKGYLVASANKGGLQSLLIDWIPAPLFYDLMDLVAVRARAIGIQVK